MPIVLIKPKRFADERGWFSETYNADAYKARGLEVTFCQDNHSLSRAPGVLRGLHFQRPPYAQAKLIRCVRGRIWDVVVDIRRGSPTFGKWAGVELDQESGVEMFVPMGFAHGFVALDANTEVEYKVSAYYARDCEGGVIWNDPDIGVDWRLGNNPPMLSPKDLMLPRLADIASPFDYDGTPMFPSNADAIESPMSASSLPIPALQKEASR